MKNNSMLVRTISGVVLLIIVLAAGLIGNILLWQLAYSEFYFADVHWPDFSKQELEKAVESFNSRKRRFGKVDEE